MSWEMRPAHNYGLDLVRGLCAIGIAAYHFLAWKHDVRLQSLGTFGVFTFFIMSSLVLMMLYAETFAHQIDRASLLQFFRRRAARIIPLLAAVALFALPYRWLTSDVNPIGRLGETVLTASGLFALHAPGRLATTPGAWSLGIELLFYALFPIIALLAAAKGSMRSLLIALVILTAGQQTLLATLPPRGTEGFGPLFFMPLTMAPFFVVGLVVFHLPRAAGSWSLPLALLCLAAVFTFSEIFPFNVYEGGWQFILLIVLSGGAVYFAYHADLGWARRPAKYLGDISYSLYLTHWIAADLSGRGISGAFWFAVLAIGIATATTRLFEMPMRDMLSGRRKRNFQTGTEAQAA